MIDGLRRVAAAADAAGVRLGLEPIHASQRDALTLIKTIPQALELLYEAGLPDVGVMVDLWHVWDTPEVERHLAENVDRITGVHVSDWFPDARSDRALPGRALATELMRVLAGRRLARRLGRRDLRRPATAPTRCGRSTWTRPRAAPTRRSLERPAAEREHVRDERLRLVVEPPLADGPLALVPRGEREPLIAVEPLQQVREQRHPDLDTALTRLRDRFARAAPSRRTSTTSGITCIGPQAPTDEVMFVWKPDSCQASARARLTGMP